MESPVWNPDKKIALYAVRLALLQKAASGLGNLIFIWATVVVLGGLAGTLKSIDFWFVCIILIAQGARIICRSSELAAEVASSRRSDPDFESFLRAKKYYSYMIQEYSALTCFVLSSLRLASRHYGASNDLHRNRALTIFYGLSLAESFLMINGGVLKFYTIISPTTKFNEGKLYQLIGKIIHYYGKVIQIMCLGISIEDVNKHYGLRGDSQHAVRRFFYDAYSRCVNGSVIDGFKMEFVSYSVQLLQSSDAEEQRTGARVIYTLVKNNCIALEKLRAIGKMPDVVERLIEILKWEKLDQLEIRRAAAEILSKLVDADQNRILLTAIAGSMESIASLLYDSYRIEIHSRQNENTEYDYSGFSLLGLGILKMLANNHDNCSKIGSDRGLLPRIIGLTESKPKTPKYQSETAKVALQLIGLLASSTGSTRKMIWEIIFARDVLQNREISTHGLQMLAIDTLTSLAREQEGRESIGGTGGVLHNLFSLFFMERINSNDETKELVTKAGEALGFLSLESKHNCEIMISIDWSGQRNLIARLISVLNNPVQGIHGARILRNLCPYVEAYCVELEEITATAAQVVVFVMEKQGEHQEAAIGLAAQIFKFMTNLDFDRVFKERFSEIKRSLISKLVEVFRRHPRPSQEVPSIRRFSIELLIAVMEKDRSPIEIEMRSKLEEALEGVMKTTSELESYSAFSGTVGLSSHCMAIRSLAQSAMALLRNLDIDAEGCDQSALCNETRIDLMDPL